MFLLNLIINFLSNIIVKFIFILFKINEVFKIINLYIFLFEIF